MPSSHIIHPFLKWAGSKRQVMPHILKVLPEGKRLIEPFVGSGTVFLNTKYSKYLLADNNFDLINVFMHVQKEGEDFFDYAKKYYVEKNNQKERFYELREQFNAATDLREKAALFIYFNRHGYNGLCRYNSKGVFNVPFGSYKNPGFPQDALKKFYEKIFIAQLHHQDFLETFKLARKNDVIYCDPPYVPLSDSANFTSYSKNDFGEEQQIALAEIAKATAKKGIPVVVSNHANAFTRKIYKGARILTFEVARSISCNAEKRNAVKELLAVFE